MRADRLPGTVSASFWPVALLVFTTSVIVRLVHLGSMQDSPFFHVLLGDAQAYDGWARQIASGDVLGHDVFYQAPLYAYFLGAIYVVHTSTMLVRVCQAVIGAGASALIGYAAHRLFGRPSGLAAGLILSFYAPAVFFGGLLQKSVLDLFFVSLLIALLSDAIVDPRRHRKGALWFAIGMVLGALALTRENALVFVPVLIGWLWLRSSRNIGRAAPGMTRLLAGLALVLLPVGFRNLIVGGEFHLTTTQSGPNFFIGNNPRADGTYVALRSGRGSPEYERVDAGALATRALGRTLSAGEISSYWTGRAFDYIRTSPVDWMALETRKLRLLLNATEVIDTESQESHEDYSLPLRALARIGHFGVLLPLACLGGWITWSQRERLGLLMAMAAAYSLSVLAFYVVARYRLPLVPFLIVFAAAGVVPIRRFMKTQTPRGALIGTVSLSAVTIFCNLPFVSVAAMRAASYQNLAVAFQENSELDNAAQAYRRALSFEPDYAPALNGLGSVLRVQGKVDDAVSYLQSALRTDPDFDDARFNLANALSERGEAFEAIAQYEQLLRRRPDAVDLHSNLGIALTGVGRLDDAIREFRTAVALSPDAAKSRYNLGHSLLTRGDVGEAIAELARAVEIDPTDVAAYEELGNAYLAGKRLNDAAATYREALGLAPRSAEIHNNLGIVLGSLGERDQALEEFRRALQIDPSFEEARANLQRALAHR